VSCAEAAEPFEMLFACGLSMSPRNHVLGGGSDPPWEGAILNGKGRLIVKYRDTLPRGVQKMAEPIEILCELFTRMGPRKHVLGVVHTGATWQMPLYRPCAAAVMRPFCQII